jgi:hypothetical protein
MYTAPHATIAGSAATGALAVTGLNVAAYLVGAATLVFLGLALARLVPRSES